MPYFTLLYFYLLYNTSYRRFCLIFRCHGNGVSRGRIYLTSFNGPPTNTTYRRKRHRDICYTSGVIASFVSNFVAMVVVKSDWHHSIDRPRKPPGRRTHLRDICYTSRVIVDFVLNFVAMTGGLVVIDFVWHQSIARRPTPKSPCYTQRSWGYLLYKPS